MEQTFLNNLKNLKPPNANKAWYKNTADLIASFKTTDDVKNFLNNPVIRGTMFHHNVNDFECYFLKTSERAEQYRKAIIEDPTGNPPACRFHPESSGNIIHHAYSLEQLLRHTKIGFLNDIKNMYEFGGGYGSFIRLMRKMGYTGRVYSYDLPLFSELQKYFLGCLNLDHNISFINKIEKTEVDLFVALWSISETPMKVRQEIFRNIKFKYCIIAYQPHFEGINNADYFEGFQDRDLGIKWHSYEIEHLKPNRYLIGIKK